ncbi:ABC transporter permease subunit [Elstera litoralis]|uniref:ABC transporter permease subunit n=1 Tax=Elstera litoralis TaxID=552518 RepID=UPI0038BAFBA0
MEIAASILVAVMMAATPLLLAALGELITEKSGVLNLGVEGMMLVGAVCAFAVAHQSGNAYFGVIAGAWRASGWRRCLPFWCWCS